LLDAVEDGRLWSATNCLGQKPVDELTPDCNSNYQSDREGKLLVMYINIRKSKGETT